MGLSSILSTATTGLNVVQTELQWRTDNINNQNTTGYSRRDPSSIGTGNHGVTATIIRANDSDLQKQYLDANTSSSASATTSDYYSRLADIMGTSQSTPYLQNAMDKFTSAWEAFETDTSSSSSESQVVSTGQTVATTITSAATQLRQVGDEAKGAAADDVTTLNTKLSALATINKKLTANPSATTNQPDLLDQRDSLVTDISGLVGVSIVTHSDNSVALYTKTGSVLVDQEANQYQWNTDTSGNGYVTLAGTSDSSSKLNTTLTGGKLGATLNFLSSNTSSTDPNVGTLAKAQAQLDAFATQLSDTSATSTFEGAYDAATSDRTTDLTSGFFTIDTTGTQTPSESLAVDPTLVAGTATVKRQSATAVIAQLTADTRSMSAGGVSADAVTYSGLASAIAGYQSDSQATATTAKTSSATTTTTLQTRLSNETGVNLDNEMAQMTALQTSYQANAKVITTVQAMFDVLLNIGN